MMRHGSANARQELQALIMKAPVQNLERQRVGSPTANYCSSTGMSTQMPIFRLFLSTLITFLFLENLSFTVCRAQESGQANSDTVTLCFISDTQEPMSFERLFLKYNNNAEARKLIFEKICAIHPRAVVHLGDLVSRGSAKGVWKEVDQFTARLADLGIEFSPIPGNHEYLWTAKKGIANFTSRYPNARVTGYSRQYGEIAVVLFNSNFAELSREDQRNQLSWYHETLTKYQGDTSVHFIIVGCHHSPFTNSKIVTPSSDVQNYYVPAFYSTPKCRLFVSGHAHAYEHFNIKGKDFLVIGGGGGLQHPLRLGRKARYADLFSTTEEKRMFHFLRVRAFRDTMTVELDMLQSDFEQFHEYSQLTFSFDSKSEMQPVR